MSFAPKLRSKTISSASTLKTCQGRKGESRGVINPGRDSRLQSQLPPKRSRGAPARNRHRAIARRALQPGTTREEFTPAGRTCAGGIEAPTVHRDDFFFFAVALEPALVHDHLLQLALGLGTFHNALVHCVCRHKPVHQHGLASQTQPSTCTPGWSEGEGQGEVVSLCRAASAVRPANAQGLANLRLADAVATVLRLQILLWVLYTRHHTAEGVRAG